MDKEEYVYTATGDVVEGTFGTFSEDYNTLVRFEAYGKVVKHRPYGFGEDREEEEVLYEHRLDLKQIK